MGNGMGGRGGRTQRVIPATHKIHQAVVIWIAVVKGIWGIGDGRGRGRGVAAKEEVSVKIVARAGV